MDVDATGADSAAEEVPTAAAVAVEPSPNFDSGSFVNSAYTLVHASEAHTTAYPPRDTTLMNSARRSREALPRCCVQRARVTRSTREM